jgi:hypothetical protein
MMILTSSWIMESIWTIHVVRNIRMNIWTIWNIFVMTLNITVMNIVRIWIWILVCIWCRIIICNWIFLRILHWLICLKWIIMRLLSVRKWIYRTFTIIILIICRWRKIMIWSIWCISNLCWGTLYILLYIIGTLHIYLLFRF